MFRPLNISNHGGECCGIRHLHSFSGDGSLEEKIRHVKNGIEGVLNIYNIGATGIALSNCNCPICQRDREVGSRTAEENRRMWESAINVVLTTEQCLTWREAVEACGFKEVVSFTNSNSGNRCHVFYLITGEGN
jgi:hypothetical protein